MAAPYYTYGGNLLNREKYTSVVKTPYGIRRYFSSIDTDVYFGDILIDEMVAFDFVLDEKKIPVFGYNNFTAKRLLTGQKTIQGSFAINFIKSFNLKLVIDSLPDSIYANDYEEAMFYCGNDNQALFGKGFDITLSYGNARGEGSYNACTQTLVGCYITSYRQAFDTSGEPILDMYTFVAKDLLIQTDFENENVRSLGDFVTNNLVDAEELNKPETYVSANSNDLNEMQNLLDSCESYPDDTLGIEINPVYSYTDSRHRIFITLTPHNSSDFSIEELKIKIDDSEAGVKAGPYSFEQQTDQYSFYLDIPIQENAKGNKIKKYFEDGNDSMNCIIYLRCVDTKNGTDKNIDLGVTTDGISTQLHYK